MEDWVFVKQNKKVSLAKLNWKALFVAENSEKLFSRVIKASYQNSVGVATSYRNGSHIWKKHGQGTLC